MKGQIFIHRPSFLKFSPLMGHAVSARLPSFKRRQTRKEQAGSVPFTFGRRNQRKDLISQIQKMTHDKTIWLPLTSTNSPAGFGPRIKGNPYKVQPLLWFTAPFEDIELAK